ncbi:MAG: AarF/ABC1/UbiB kinase family protein [Deltaproteobacteria bacterium]|nr:AarF/ABC1/UbiB kinase family protein [Deltaproteobacteria bacterium]
MSLLGTVRDLDRLRQITQVLARHGFGELATRLGLGKEGKAEDGTPLPRPLLGERLRLVFQELGPTFIKLGQLLSTRSDLLPEDVVAELSRLQDAVPPIPEAAVREQVQEALGAPIEELFVTFDATPLACASVAQVHRATLRLPDEPEPRLVAVKVQRPGIAVTVQRDLELLHLLARTLERTLPATRVYSPVGLAEEFDRTITAELDFTIEAHNAEQFARNFEGDPAVRFPRIYRQVSSRRVLTMEFLDGLKVDKAVEAGASAQWVAETAVRVLLKMLFEDGFFHADPHPGNVLVLPRPADGGYAPAQPLVFGLLDLGSVGFLPPQLRDGTVDLIIAAARNDAEAIADALLSLARPGRKVELEPFRQHVRNVSRKHLGRPLKEMEGSALLRDLIVGAMKFDLEIPTELTMMTRAILTVEGVGKQLYPELDLFGVARPHLARIVWQRYHPMRLVGELGRGAGRLGTLARDLPMQLHELLEDLRHGRLRVRTVDPAAARATERLGRRLRAAIVSTALLGSGVALLVAGKEPALARGLLWAALAAFALHLIGDLRDGKKRAGE